MHEAPDSSPHIAEKKKGEESNVTNKTMWIAVMCYIMPSPPY